MKADRAKVDLIEDAFGEDTQGGLWVRIIYFFKHFRKKIKVLIR